MTNDNTTDLEQKLARLRKLYAFARSHNNLSWMERIRKDANKLKETPPDDTYERMKELVDGIERS